MVYLLNMVIFHGYVSHNQRVDTKSNGFPTANIRQFVMWKTPWVSPEIWSSNVFFSTSNRWPKRVPSGFFENGHRKFVDLPSYNVGPPR